MVGDHVGDVRGGAWLMAETEFVWVKQKLDGEEARVQVPKRALAHWLERGFEETDPPPRRERPVKGEKKKPSKKAEPSDSGQTSSEGNS